MLRKKTTITTKNGEKTLYFDTIIMVTLENIDVVNRQKSNSEI